MDRNSNDDDDYKSKSDKSSNFLSRITFFFVLPMFLRSRRREFLDTNNFEKISDFSSTLWGNKLENEWRLEKLKKKPCILRSLWKVFGYRFLIFGSLSIGLDMIVMFVTPNLMGRVVAYFSPKDKPESRGEITLNIILLISSVFLRVLLMHSFVFALKQLTLKIRIACSALIYRKALKLRTCLSQTTISGKAVTLISKDLLILDMTAILFHQMVTGILKILIMVYTIYGQIGVAAFVGVTVVVTLILLQALLVNKCIQYRIKSAKKTENRINLIQEMVSSIKIIKMYTWEKFFCKSIDTTRRTEVRSSQLVIVCQIFASALGFFNGRMSLFTCIVAFVAFGNHITAESAFIVAGSFATLGSVLNVHIPLGFVSIAEIKVILRRLTDYLMQEEVTPNRSEKTGEVIKLALSNVTAKRGARIVLKDVSLTFRPGVTLITGPIASGKSTLLNAILSEVTTNGRSEISGSVSYASQEPWIFPGSIRHNIVFNETFDVGRYETVLKLCALEKDLDNLEDGDGTILANKGLNLSEGQKFRINLARAVYKPADIYLLDDCLSTLDLQVGKHIFNECIKTFLGTKICLLVSHLHPFITDINEIITINEGNVEVIQGVKGDEVLPSITYSINATNSSKVCNTYDDEEHSSLLTDRKEPPRKASIYQEKVKGGSVSKDIYAGYLIAGGFKTFVAVVIVLILKQTADSWSNYCVSFWVNSEQNLTITRTTHTSDSVQYESARETRNDVLNEYFIGILVSLCLIFIKAVVHYKFACRVSTAIHKNLVERITNATMAFFNKNIAGNIINRFSRDFGVIDEHVNRTVLDSIEASLMILSVLVIVSSVNVYLLIPTIFYAFVLCLICYFYLPSGRNIRRVEGSVRSPVIGQLQTTFEGLGTIRAYGAQNVMRKDFEGYLDVYNTVLYMHVATAQAFRFYLDAFTGFYISVAVVGIVFLKESLDVGTVGMAITQLFTLSALLQYCAFYLSELEMQMTSIERLFEYMEADQETKSGNQLTGTRSNGKIVYENVSLRYTPNGKQILKNVSFTVERGEKLGIVGRTGAGKSSIISALFRLYPFNGVITVDNVDVNSIKLDEFRSRISIIPQNPTLFTGTVRTNLDPNSAYTDNELWGVLEVVNMKNKIDSLDLAMAGHSTAFSIGEKQLICLARAILQNNPIVVLDEATASIDSYTEYIIQGIIKNAFHDSTTIIIAHRLHTILECDKILVMDSGTAVECDRPQTLLQDGDSIFYGMVRDAGLL